MAVTHVLARILVYYMLRTRGIYASVLVHSPISLRLSLSLSLARSQSLSPFFSPLFVAVTTRTLVYPSILLGSVVFVQSTFLSGRIRVGTVRSEAEKKINCKATRQKTQSRIDRRRRRLRQL